MGCISSWSSTMAGQTYLVCYTTFTIFGPLVLTSVCYCMVWRAFRISQRRVNIMNTLKRPKTASYLPYASKTEIRLLKMLFFMVFCFIVLWTPYVVRWFLQCFKPDLILSEYFILTSQWFCRIQPVLDPVIYGYLNKQFRKSLCDMLRVCSQCSLYYSNDMPPSTGSGEYDTPQSSDHFRPSEQFSHPVHSNETYTTTPTTDCSWFCARRHTSVSNKVLDPLESKEASTKKFNSGMDKLTKEREMKGTISYISQKDPLSLQKRNSLTYHISGSVHIQPNTQDEDSVVQNHPKTPVWYLGGAFPLKPLPIKNVGKLPPIKSKEDSYVDEKVIRTFQADSKNALCKHRSSMKSKRKRKKILNKRIDAKKCYSSGGVYLGPPS